MAKKTQRCQEERQATKLQLGAPSLTLWFGMAFGPAILHSTAQATRVPHHLIGSVALLVAPLASLAYCCRLAAGARRRRARAGAATSMSELQLPACQGVA